MSLQVYNLNSAQREKLKKGIAASLAIPLIDSLEDFIWEAVFCYTKGIQLVDPLFDIRSKLLFDIVQEETSIGWSAKSLQCAVRPNLEFELVIQRADVFKKRDLLGFPNLDLNSSPNEIGAALMAHWHKKINEDAIVQGVTDKRICVLLKKTDNSTFAYMEEELAVYSPNELRWEWTNTSKTGLRGFRQSDDFCVYRWYPNQKQFFERFRLPENAFIFDLEIIRLELESVIEMLYSQLQDIQESSEPDDT